MKSIKIIGLISLAMFLAGCANDAKVQNASANHKRAGEQSRFDDAKDPPFNPQTHFAAGQLAESQNDPRRAVQQYEKAIELDPEHANSLYRLGVIHCSEKRYDQAIAAWKKYIKATDGSANGYGNLGFCHELAGETEMAEAAYLKGIKKEPRNESCRINYGLMLARHGRTNEAVLQLQTILKPAAVHYNLGSVYEQQGRREQAMAEYRRAIEIDPKFKDAQIRLSAMD